MSVRSEVIRIVNELLAGSKKISELPAGTSPSGTELIEVVQNGTNVSLTVSQVSGAGGVEHFRGDYDASGNAYPSSGGTGPSGVPSAGDEWFVYVPGDLDVDGLGVITVNSGALLKSRVTTPGQTPSNWRVIQ